MPWRQPGLWSLKKIMDHKIKIEVIQHSSGYRFVVKYLYKLGLEDRVEVMESDLFPSKEIAELKAREYISRLKAGSALTLT